MKRIVLFLILLSCVLRTMAQIPTRTEFLAACDSLQIRHGYVVWAQARLESGNFKSTMYQTKHNCLGIYDSKRHEYARFEDWLDCLKAYRDRVQYRHKDLNATDEEYVQWLMKIGYAAGKSYDEKVLEIMYQEKRKDSIQ